MGVHQEVDVEATFWSATALTRSSGVQVYSSPNTYALGEWGYPYGTFGTSWPTAAFSCPGGQVNRTTVSKLAYSDVWHYRVPTGSGAWIAMPAVTDRVMYVTRTTPVRAEPAITFEFSTDYCAGLDATSTGEQVGDAVQAGMAAYYQYDGTCQKEASNFVRLVGVQGISGTVHRWQLNPAGADDIWRMWTHLITLINPVSPPWPAGQSRVRWTNYHAWATAGGINLDVSGNGNLPGTWGEYEDYLFRTNNATDYDLNGGGSIVDPQDQTDEINNRGVTHTQPAPWAFDPNP